MSIPYEEVSSETNKKACKLTSSPQMRHSSKGISNVDMAIKRNGSHMKMNQCGVSPHILSSSVSFHEIEIEMEKFNSGDDVSNINSFLDQSDPLKVTPEPLQNDISFGGVSHEFAKPGELTFIQSRMDASKKKHSMTINSQTIEAKATCSRKSDDITTTLISQAAKTLDPPTSILRKSVILSGGIQSLMETPHASTSSEMVQTSHLKLGRLSNPAHKRISFGGVKVITPDNVSPTHEAMEQSHTEESSSSLHDNVRQRKSSFKPTENSSAGISTFFFSPQKNDIGYCDLPDTSNTSQNFCTYSPILDPNFSFCSPSDPILRHDLLTLPIDPSKRTRMKPIPPHLKERLEFDYSPKSKRLLCVWEYPSQERVNYRRLLLAYNRKPSPALYKKLQKAKKNYYKFG